MRVKPVALATILALTLPLPALARPADLDALREKALADDLAWSITEGLTTEVGPRPAGTEAEARARDWSVAKLKALGFQNVRVDPFAIPVWVRGTDSAEITAPFPQKLVVAALGNSGSTPPEGVTAEVVGFDTLEALQAADPAKVKGKIVFVSHAMAPTQDGSGYGLFGGPRRKGPSVASAKGAVGIVIRSIGTDYHRNPHTGVQSFDAGVAPIPAGALSLPDAEQLQRMLARGKPVTMKLVLTSTMLADQPSGNVIAELPGRDPRAGLVVVGCHLDSWDLGTGAIDDAVGCGIVTAAAKLATAGGKTLRTIRVVWFGAEETGVFGGIAYRDAHKGEKHHVLAESDFGAGRVWKMSSSVRAEAIPVIDRLAVALAPLGIVRGDNKARGGADVAPLGATGVPVMSLHQDGTRYFDLHHTPDDTLDKIDKEELRQNVAAWAVMLGVVANDPAEFGPTEPWPAG